MKYQNSCGGSFATAQDDRALRGHRGERSGDSMKKILSKELMCANRHFFPPGPQTQCVIPSANEGSPRFS